jgi:hypothetical protein
MPGGADEKSLLHSVRLPVAWRASTQAISLGFDDPAFAASLNNRDASTKVDLPDFSVEVSLLWGLPAT